MLKKDIKKTILETKEKKDRRLVSEQLVKSRILMIIESEDNLKKNKKLSEKKQLELSFSILQELYYLEQNDLLVEQDLLGMLKGLFGTNVLGSITQTLFEPMINSILSSLGMGDNLFKKFVISYLTSNMSEVVKSFGDCKIMTKLIAESFAEALVMMMQQEKGFGGTGYDLIRNSLGSAIKGTSFIQGLERGMENIVCNLFSKFTGNAKDVVAKLKPSLGIS